MIYGIDVSHWQNPATLPWAKFAEQSKFCIVRASYGTMRDRQTLEHLKRARGAGLKVGCYHFYRPSQSATLQLDTFMAQLDLAKIGSGDIVPVLDVEADPLPSLQHVTPAWQDGVRTILAALRDRFTNAMVYITQREFGQLGSPEWLLTFPLWVAHYSTAAEPAKPGNRPWTIWQHRVGPYMAFGPGGYDKAHPDLDQNRAVDLPLIGAVKHELVPQPADTHESDDGLEELIAQHNKHLFDVFTRDQFERLIEAPSLGGGRGVLEYEQAGLVDDNDTGGGSDSNA
jgi:lysozyme